MNLNEPFEFLGHRFHTGWVLYQSGGSAGGVPYRIVKDWRRFSLVVKEGREARHYLLMRPDPPEVLRNRTNRTGKTYELLEALDLNKRKEWKTYGYH